MSHAAFTWIFALACLGCTGEVAGEPLGSLSLGLTTEAGGASYRLSKARFTLEGPVSRDITAKEEKELSIALAAGAYKLTLLDGWSLVESGEHGGKVAARLVSENPSALVVNPGETTRAVLRFELTGGANTLADEGTLEVSLEVDDDAGVGASCGALLRIVEVDYEQAGTDQSEFVEIEQAADCEASLEGVFLELVNGGDGEVYGRYELAKAARVLGPFARLVVGDPSLLLGLPSAVETLPLTGAGLQNGPDGVRLVREGTILDALSYEGSVPGAEEGMFAPGDSEEAALARCPDGFDAGDNATDFALVTPTPGSANACR